jgi:hypothetical protein
MIIYDQKHRGENLGLGYKKTLDLLRVFACSGKHRIIEPKSVFE